jgi:hypothetical protein
MEYALISSMPPIKPVTPDFNNRSFMFGCASYNLLSVLSAMLNWRLLWRKIIWKGRFQTSSKCSEDSLWSKWFSHIIWTRFSKEKKLMESAMRERWKINWAALLLYTESFCFEILTIFNDIYGVSDVCTPVANRYTATIHKSVHLSIYS